jgi:AraC-like DNA-binding protein
VTRADLVERAPARPLHGLVSSYSGFRLSGLEPGEIRGLPSRSLTLMVAFDEPIDVIRMPDPTRRPASFWSMLGGLHTTPAIVGHHGRQHGIEVAITPAGACALFDILPGEIGSQIVAVADVAPSLATTLSERLGEHAGWDARFDVLDDVLSAAVRPRRALPAAFTSAWQILTETDGACTVGSLADHAASSTRQLSSQFKHVIGVSPKQAARVMRFERAQEMMRSCPGSTIARIAASSGYADQSHMAREWHDLAGPSPTDWRREELRFVQDERSAEEHCR